MASQEGGSFVVLAGDVGGTNCRFALYQVNREDVYISEADMLNAHKHIFARNYKNNDFEHFSDAVSTFLDDASEELDNPVGSIASACFAVAGPVFQNVVKLTNRGWLIAGIELERMFQIGEVKLVNDFAANGYGLLTLDEKEYEVLQEGNPDPTAPIGLIGAGTGLGECFLTCKAGEYDAFPCEGGHVEFAPRTELQMELLRFLAEKFGTDTQFGRVSTERIVSGKGIVNVYEFLSQKYPEQVDQPKHEQIVASAEGGKLISTMAYDYSLAKQTMEIMMAAYGAEAGNLGLKLLPYGSIYIAGGIAPHNIEYMRGSDSIFMRAFKEKGRVSSVLNDVPIRLVRSEDLGLRGAHVVATRLLHSVCAPPPTAPAAAAVSAQQQRSKRASMAHGAVSRSGEHDGVHARGPPQGSPQGASVGVDTLAVIALTSVTAAFAGAAFYHALTRR